MKVICYLLARRGSLIHFLSIMMIILEAKESGDAVYQPFPIQCGVVLLEALELRMFRIKPRLVPWDILRSRKHAPRTRFPSVANTWPVHVRFCSCTRYILYYSLSTGHYLHLGKNTGGTRPGTLAKISPLL